MQVVNIAMDFDQIAAARVAMEAVHVLRQYADFESIYRLYTELAQGFDIIFSIGTTSIFPYIAGPVMHAIQLGIPTVEINPGETRVSAIVTYKLAAGAAASLRALNEALHDARERP